MPKLKIILSLLIILLQLSCSTNLSTSEDTVIIRGSDTMFDLTKLLSEKFTENNPSVKIRVYGGGTGAGIIDLINNKIDISAASRSLTPNEIKILAELYGSIGLSTLIAKDAICIYVNKGNKINDFTLEELKDIFTGKVTNWNYFDGPAKTITPVNRNKESGTRKIFQTVIMNREEFSQNIIEKNTTNGVIDAVAEDQYKIGFGGLTNRSDVSFTSIESIYPTEKNIRTDKYPLSRYLTFYTSKNPKGSAKKFIDWVLSPEGQKIIKDMGFVPLWEMNY